MDPRHPELVPDRVKTLVEQFLRIEDDIRHATVAAKLGQLEREGGLVVQEICLTAPRLHEAMMQTSRQRRHDLSRGVVEKPVENLQETPELPEEKPKKKITRKKKTTKKADKECKEK